PTVINGGIINAYGTNARLGDGDWMVVEADESDGTFIKLPATIAVVTNIDPEHLEFYGDFDALRAALDTFVQNIPFYGFAALCVDHPEVQAMIPRVSDRKIVTYGLTPPADVRAVDIRSEAGSMCFDVEFTDRARGEIRRFSGIRLPMPGLHNVQNAVAAIAVADELGVDEDVIVRALAEFGGVKRRFTRVGEGAGIVVIDDYAHHPVEIAAVLAAARDTTEGRVIAIFQPHRFTRLQALFEDFCAGLNAADAVIVADVYPAGEAPIPGIDRDAVVEGLRARGHRQVVALGDPKQLPRLVADLGAPGDLAICLGAGTVSQWAQTLPEALAALAGAPSRDAGGRGS
ncbi:MAG: UDP-N-acetylmuramate--L-alanine ligase, partial [Alphaproteobacteria bacterium]